MKGTMIKVDMNREKRYQITRERDEAGNVVSEKIIDTKPTDNDVNKIISNFKKGVADAFFRGKENNPNNLDYYRQGYDYGISLYSETNEKNDEILWIENNAIN